MTIRLMHASEIFFRNPRIQPFYSSWFYEQTCKAVFSHEEYLTCALKALSARPDAMAAIEASPAGIYLFGHNHMQFNAVIDVRIFINPGSCGIPLDGCTDAAYTLLDIEGTSYQITEQRAAYDIREPIEMLRSSSLWEEAPEWSRIVEKGLLDGLDYFPLFLKHVDETTRRLEDQESPVSDYTWQTASETWNFDTMTKREY